MPVAVDIYSLMAGFPNIRPTSPSSRLFVPIRPTTTNMARLLPSLLFLPASSQKILSSALKIPATKVPHAFVLDLEDSVPLSQKAVARENAVDVLSKVADGGWRGDAEIWVRINGVGTGEEVEDLKAIVGSLSSGVHSHLLSRSRP